MGYQYSYILMDLGFLIMWAFLFWWRKNARKEMLLLNIYSTTTVGVVIDPSKKNTIISLRLPVAANPGDRITISRKVGDRFRLIGYGILQ